MENKSIRRTLYRVLRKTGVTRDKIRLNASFTEDLNFDQLDWTLYVYYLEGFFRIHLSDNEISKMTFVEDTLKVINNRVAC